MKNLRNILILLCITALSGFLLLRYQFYFKYYNEIEFVKSFWAATITNDLPTKQWKNYLNKNALERGGDNFFYGFKVWFAKYSPNNPDIDLLSVDYASNIHSTVNGESIETDYVGVDYKYGEERQRLHAVVHVEDGQYKLYPSLSLDHCDWTTDIDGNGVTDQKDVELVMKQKAGKPEK